MIQPSARSGAVARHDVLVVGGGPAGATCAAICARAGLSVLVVERAFFPRDKVCGDCLNPDCWSVLDRLEVAEAIGTLPHADLRSVEFQGLRGPPIHLPLPAHSRGEIAVKRSVFDHLLLQNTARRGAEIWQGVAVTRVQRAPGGFTVEIAPDDAVSPEEGAAGHRTVSSRFLVAADGRNSVVARLLGLLDDRRNRPADRIGFQAHVPCPPDFGARVQMRWFPWGYGGLCPVGAGELNVSLAGPPASLQSFKPWARETFGLAADHPWRTIAPLDRLPAKAAARAFDQAAVFLVGDAARVVEPFTGEGIYYALRTGELAAQSVVAAAVGEIDAGGAAARYRAAHAAAYRGRLWVNRLARLAGRHPRAASWGLRAARWQPRLLGLLTKKVVG